MFRSQSPILFTEPRTLSIDLTTPRTTEASDAETEKTDKVPAVPENTDPKNLESKAVDPLGQLANPKGPKNMRKKRKRVLKNGNNNSDEEKTGKTSYQPSVSDFFLKTVRFSSFFRTPIFFSSLLVTKTPDLEHLERVKSSEKALNLKNARWKFSQTTIQGTNTFQKMREYRK